MKQSEMETQMLNKSLLVLLALMIGCEKKDVEKKAQPTPGEKYFAMSLTFSNEAKVDLAKIYLDSAKTHFKSDPIALANLESDLSKVADSTKIREAVLALDYNGILSLKEGHMRRSFLINNPTLDSIFVENMKAALMSNNQWIKVKKKEQDDAIKAARQAEVGKRGEYGAGLRNEFLDAGFDIRVKVHGKENRRLKLSYPLFNAVFARKFQKEGMLEKWVKEGFYEVELSDGYDYNAKWDLKKYH